MYRVEGGGLFAIGEGGREERKEIYGNRATPRCGICLQRAYTGLRSTLFFSFYLLSFYLLYFPFLFISFFSFPFPFALTSFLPLFLSYQCKPQLITRRTKIARSNTTGQPKRALPGGLIAAVAHIRHEVGSPTALTNSVGTCRGCMLPEASPCDMKPTFAANSLAHLQWWRWPR